MFQAYSKILYPLTDENGIEKVYNLTDILTRVKLVMTEKGIYNFTDLYTIIDGETPETISYKLYGSVDYYWTILFINELYDYLSDWFMSEEQLLKYCEEKYGIDIDKEKYVMDNYGIVRLSADPEFEEFQNNFTNVKYSGDMTIINNYGWESIQNETKRQIRVIKPSRIIEFVNLFNLQISK